ncbi:hypothetical protein V6N12_020986 [Hibiscus sabdariffa]|uniref:Uncharacterized protein n=1 Tax=Hibiscus sabdariffa TaxID=183260 RepID=A0ABR2D0J7_9ROSI
MKRAKWDSFVSLSRLRLVQFLMGVLFLYLLFMSFEIPLVFKTGSAGFYTDALPRPLFLESEEDFTDKSAPARPDDGSSYAKPGAVHRRGECGSLRKCRVFFSTRVLSTATILQTGSRCSIKPLVTPSLSA